MSAINPPRDPQAALEYELRQLRARVEELEKGSPINNATLTGRIELDGAGSVGAGSTQVTTAGLWTPWQQGTALVESLIHQTRGDAIAAMTRANGAFSLGEMAGSAAAAAMTRANGAFSLGEQVRREASAAAALAQSAGNLAGTALSEARSVAGAITALSMRQTMLASTVNQIIDRTSWKAGSTPPPKLNF